MRVHIEPLTKARSLILGHPTHSFRAMFVVFLVIFLFLTGCSQITKWEKQDYKDKHAYAVQAMEHWSFDSGYYSCALGAASINFKIDQVTATDLEALVNNPLVISGIAKLDDLAKKTTNPKTGQPFWDSTEWALGCTVGVKTRMTVSQVINAIQLMADVAKAIMK